MYSEQKEVFSLEMMIELVYRLQDVHLEKGESKICRSNHIGEFLLLEEHQMRRKMSLTKGGNASSCKEF